jgi:hypothetical protein
MTIPNNREKSNIKPLYQNNKLFLIVFTVCFLIGVYGLSKLYIIEHNKVPITLETKENVVKATSTPFTPVASSSVSTKTSIQSGMYLGSRGGTAYYLPTCSGAQRISAKNKIWFSSKEEAERLGYKPSKTCKGL